MEDRIQKNNEFNFRDSMTDCFSSSENSFKVTVEIDHEKIHNHNKPSTYNNCYILHELMSSTSETLDKEKNSRFLQFNKQRRNEPKDQKFRKGRFTIKKMPLKKTDPPQEYKKDMPHNYPKQYQCKNCAFEKIRNKEETKLTKKNAKRRISKPKNVNFRL